jgi:hypothetical protein
MGKMKRLFEMRRRYWRAAEEMQLQKLGFGVPFMEREFVQPSRLSPFSLTWKDDIEAYEEENYYPDY